MEPGGREHKEFISEPIIPEGGSFDMAAMSRGEPGLPARFVWRGATYEVAKVLDRWKTVGDCHHGSQEQYVRKHWFRVELTDGTSVELYFDRQPRAGQRRQGWWLAAVVESAAKTNRSDRNDQPTGGRSAR